MALVLALGLLATSRFDPSGHDDGILGYMFLMPLVAICATALALAAVRRSAWAGVRAAVWTALLVSLAFYAISVSEAARIYAGDGNPVHILGGTIRELTVLLDPVPVPVAAVRMRCRRRRLHVEAELRSQVRDVGVGSDRRG